MNSTKRRTKRNVDDSQKIFWRVTLYISSGMTFDEEKNILDDTLGKETQLRLSVISVAPGFNPGSNEFNKDAPNDMLMIVK